MFNDLKNRLRESHYSANRSVGSKNRVPKRKHETYGLMRNRTFSDKTCVLLKNTNYRRTGKRDMTVSHGTIGSTHLARLDTFADGTSILAQLEAVLTVESTHDGRAGRRLTLGLTQLPGVEPVVVAPTAAVDKLSTNVPSFVEVPAQ